VSFFWGDPAPYVERVHSAGGFVMHSVGDTEEARRAVASGVDAVVAQGWEAGGHVRGNTALSVLLPAVCDAIAPVPVIAAGGIADGRGVAAALVLGAQAAWLGTRFVASTEAFAHSVYQQAILQAGDDATHHGIIFDGGWPNAPHRALVNDTVRRAVAAASDHRPGEHEVVAVRANGENVVRYSDVVPLKGMTGDVAELALYAGQSAALVRDIQPAAALVERLVVEAEAALRNAVSLG